MKPNLWFKIWVKPKETIRPIIDKSPKKTIIWLALAAGVVSALMWSGYLQRYYQDKLPANMGFFIIGTCIIGALAGLFHLYFGGWLYRLTGSWLGGKGDFTSVKCALGWSYYPFLVGNIVNLIGIAFYQLPFVNFVFSLASAVILIWAIILLLHLIGEAHQFSTWRALASILIAFVLVFVVIILFSLLFPLLTPLFT